MNCHRVIELYLKAFLVGEGGRVRPGGVWGHDLSDLLDLCVSLDPSFSDPELGRRVVFFQRYFDLVRYPSDIEGELKDGSGIWFAWDANILPLDQVVAFVRPRINRTWGGQFMTMIVEEQDTKKPQPRALRDHNDHLDQILAERGSATAVRWDPNFEYDLPGC